MQSVKKNISKSQHLVYSQAKTKTKKNWIACIPLKQVMVNKLVQTGDSKNELYYVQLSYKFERLHFLDSN